MKHNILLILSVFLLLSCKQHLKFMRCEECGGEGQVDTKCEECDGEGRVLKECEDCEGTGRKYLH